MKIVQGLMLSLSMVSLAGCVVFPSQDSSIYGAENLGPIGVALSSPDANAPANPMGVTGSVNMRDAQSLFSSLDAMVGGLSQRDKLAFMEAFFRVAYFERCDIVGEWGTNGNSFNGGRIRFSSCLSTAGSSRWSSEAADAYVADKRMDWDRAYVASNAFGSWTGGRSQQESYVNFIKRYGPTIDGRSADYIFQRNKDIMRAVAVSFRNR